ncbi:DUF7678 domain-containing protein [Eremococcus coleocola]|uniref:DUF7678 domain-containing protein n=1 Tax=Eremococcus coleocola TaxID=88132 RepID=UPI000417185F|nr:hypothetical protein [Eremococcus coleocola]
MWERGQIEFEGQTYRYWLFAFEEGSEYGIEEGRISKLMLKREGEIVCNYDRGWDVYPIDEETEEVMMGLFFQYQ